MSNPLSRLMTVGLLLAGFSLMAPNCNETPTYDLCSGVVVRPDQYWEEPVSACKSIWPVAAIAAAADAVLLGDSSDVVNPLVPAPPRACYPTPSHAANAPYVAELRAARLAVSTKPLYIVHMSRSELVTRTQAAKPSFNASFLLQTTRPFADVLSFFSSDRSAPCVLGDCRWSDSWGGSVSFDPSPNRLRDLIDRSIPGRSQNVVYYLNRLADPKVHWPSAAVADLRNPAYRAFRVTEAQDAIRVGGYDVIDHSQKIFQYQQNGHWIGSAFAADVEAVNRDPDDAFWSAPPSGYGTGAYITGWAALARDYKAAGVPYSVLIAMRGWQADSTRFDDPSTPTVNEADLVREAMRGATLLLLDRDRTTDAANGSAQVMAEVQALGIKGLLIDQTCGQPRVKK